MNSKYDIYLWVRLILGVLSFINLVGYIWFGSLNIISELAKLSVIFGGFAAAFFPRFLLKHRIIKYCLILGCIVGIFGSATLIILDLNRHWGAEWDVAVSRLIEIVALFIVIVEVVKFRRSSQ